MNILKHLRSKNSNTLMKTARKLPKSQYANHVALFYCKYDEHDSVLFSSSFLQLLTSNIQTNYRRHFEELKYNGLMCRCHFSLVLWLFSFITVGPSKCFKLMHNGAQDNFSDTSQLESFTYAIFSTSRICARASITQEQETLFSKSSILHRTQVQFIRFIC